MSRTIDPLVTAQAVQAYRVGWPVPQITAHYGICYKTLCKHLKVAGVGIRGRLSDAVVAAVLQDYTSGKYSTDELGQKYGVCGHTVRTHLKRRGLAPGQGHTRKHGLSDQEWCRRHVFRTYRRHADERGFDFHLSPRQVEDMIFQPCHYCGRSGVSTKTVVLPKSMRSVKYNGIDRQNNKLGYTPENTVPCCSDCNWAKADRSVEDFLSWTMLVAAKAQQVQGNGTGV